MINLYNKANFDIYDNFKKIYNEQKTFNQYRSFSKKKRRNTASAAPPFLRRKAFRLLSLFRTRPCALPGDNVFLSFLPSLPKETGHENTACPEKTPDFLPGKLKKEGRLSRQPAGKPDPKHPCPVLSALPPGQHAVSPCTCRRRMAPLSECRSPSVRRAGQPYGIGAVPSPALPLRLCVIARRGVVPMPRRGEVQTST